MATTAKHGHGAVLTTDATTNFASSTTLGQVVSISGPNHARDSIDVSNMGSTDKWREFVNGMLDSGEFSGDIVYDGTTYAAAMSSQFTNSANYWKINIMDGTNAAASSSIYCQGFLTSLGHSIPYDDKISQSFTVKLTGVPVFAAKT